LIRVFRVSTIIIHPQLIQTYRVAMVYLVDTCNLDWVAQTSIINSKLRFNSPLTLIDVCATEIIHY